MSAAQDDENGAGRETGTKLVLVFAEQLLAVAKFLGSLLRRVVTGLKPTHSVDNSTRKVAKCHISTND